MLKKILIILALAVAVFVAIASMQPDEFHVSRSISINAPADKIFAQINNHHNWEAWSPWAKLDPNMTSSISGAATGAGSVYTWSGSGQVGEGSSTIVESRPNELVRMKLEFLKPFKGTNDVDFTLKTEGSQTIVTWNMHGKANFISKAMGLILNCKKMMNGQFDQGLKQLKAICEKTG